MRVLDSLERVKEDIAKRNLEVLEIDHQLNPELMFKNLGTAKVSDEIDQLIALTNARQAAPARLQAMLNEVSGSNLKEIDGFRMELATLLDRTQKLNTALAGLKIYYNTNFPQGPSPVALPAYSARISFLNAGLSQVHTLLLEVGGDRIAFGHELDHLRGVIRAEGYREQAAWPPLLKNLIAMGETKPESLMPEVDQLFERSHNL